MSCEVTVHDLPDEMLEKILLYLRAEDRKSALRVCKRWSALKPFDLASVELIIDSDRFYEKDYHEYHRALLASSRRYKHVVVYISSYFNKYDLLLEVLSSFCLSVESLKLNFEPLLKGVFNNDNHWWKVKLMHFAKIAELSSKLKHLQIDEGIFESEQGDLKFSPMNNLEELYLKNNLLTLIPNMRDITPNITRLHVLIKSEESLNFLQHVSSQLVELEIWFLLKDDFLLVCTMEFPRLEKLTISCIEEEFDAVQQFCRLNNGSFLFDHVGNLCLLQSFENIQFLCLGCAEELSLDANDFRAICKLKHLKRLRIENAIVSVPTVFNFPPLKNLHMLSLDGVRITDYFEFNRFRQYIFPSLAVFEMLELYDFDVEDRFELYDNICSTMPFMKRLAISQYKSNLVLGPFLEFCASPGSRELRIRCRDVLGIYPLKDLPHIPVETLIMEVSTISLRSLRKLIKAMGELKRLELAFCPLTGTMQPEEIRSLRVAFPRCEVIVKQRVQIVEPL
ncbi:uncharacterized protein LOC135699930 [Ochlerotatus camptorhynchus]|uniref:uncharacterized protein LOC135699930 n=1 Tax=Ochlerotatus camptorhynchus TaxID=644619 RepID=UPI0031D77D7C